MTQQQVTIFLSVRGEGWMPFNYPSDEASIALKERGISIGYEATVGDRATVGDEATVGYRATVGDEATVGYRATVGNHATVGDEASIGDRARIGNEARIGYRATVGDRATVGYRATVGDEASIGDRARIGNEARIGDGARINKTIFITGSRNTVNYYGVDIIHIGCIRKTIAEWQERYREVGMENGYSDEQIEEYGAYIKMIAELHKTWNIETPAAQ